MCYVAMLSSECLQRIPQSIPRTSVHFAQPPSINRLEIVECADPAAGHWAQVVATAKGTADTEPSSAPTSSTPTTTTTSATGVTSSQRLTLAEAEAALSAALSSSCSIDAASGALSAERAHERFLRSVLLQSRYYCYCYCHNYTVAFTATTSVRTLHGTTISCIAVHLI
jgi:hypothetical protein